MLTRAGVAAATKALFVTAYPLAPAPAGDDDAAGVRYLSIMGGRAPDGFKLYDAIVAAGAALPAKPAVPPADAPKVLPACAGHKTLFARPHYPPPATPPWG